MDFSNVEPTVTGDEDPQEVRIRSRRQFTYSMAALQAVASVDKIFVAHGAVTSALQALDRAYQLVGNLSSSPGVALVGPTGSGKTTLIKYFRASLPSDGLLDEQTRTIYLRLEERPAIGRLITALLRAVRYPFSSVTGQNVYAKRDILIEALRQRGTRMLFLDEAHNLCQFKRSNSVEKTGTTTTDLLRELVDEVPLSPVLIGDVSLDRLHEVDAHLAARTPIRMSLSNFDAKGPTWFGLVKAIVSKELGVGLAILANGSEILRLHAATLGNMRQLKWLIGEAVMVAVDATQKELRVEDLALAFQRLNGDDGPRSNPWKA